MWISWTGRVSASRSDFSSYYRQSASTSRRQKKAKTEERRQKHQGTTIPPTLITARGISARATVLVQKKNHSIYLNTRNGSNGNWSGWARIWNGCFGTLDHKRTSLGQASLHLEDQPICPHIDRQCEPVKVVDVKSTSQYRSNLGGPEHVEAVLTNFDLKLDRSDWPGPHL